MVCAEQFHLYSFEQDICNFTLNSLEEKIFVIYLALKSGGQK